MEVSGQLYFPAALSPRRSSSSRRMEDLMEPSLDVSEKSKISCPYRDSKYNNHNKYKSMDPFVQMGDTHWILSHTHTHTSLFQTLYN